MPQRRESTCLASGTASPTAASRTPCSCSALQRHRRPAAAAHYSVTHALQLQRPAASHTPCSCSALQHHTRPAPAASLISLIYSLKYSSPPPGHTVHPGPYLGETPTFGHIYMHFYAYLYTFLCVEPYPFVCVPRCLGAGWKVVRFCPFLTF